jgi:CheY-like chemotaxis protein
MSSLLTNTTILVVEDDHDTSELLRVVLGDHGATVLVADSVPAALALCRQNPPHLVVSDIRLGSSDGFTLIEAIREYNREYRGFTPAIALTGFVARGDEERAMASGFNAYIHKPFDPQDLLNTISSVLRKRADFVA